MLIDRSSQRVVNIIYTYEHTTVDCCKKETSRTHDKFRNKSLIPTARYYININESLAFRSL